MKQYYYLKGLRRTIIQFLDTMNDIQIARYDSNGNFTQYYKVPVKFGPKRKVWYWLKERKNDHMLPIISVTMNSLEHDETRLTGKHNRLTSSATVSSGDYSSFLNPAPYNIGFTAAIWAVNMSDIDQIIEQILPFYNPFIFFHLKIPEISDIPFDIKCLFRGISSDITLEMPDDDFRTIRYNMDFMCQGYLFRPITNTKLIHKIITKYYADEDAWAYMGTESTYTSGASGHEAESTYIKAIPPYYDDEGDKLYKYYLFQNTNDT